MEIKSSSIKIKVLLRYSPLFLDTGYFNKLYSPASELVYPMRLSQSSYEAATNFEMGDLFIVQDLSSHLSSFQTELITKAHMEAAKFLIIS